LNDKSYLCNYSNKLVFYGNFNTKKNRPNVLLLLPKTRGPFGIKEFKQAIRKKFNLLEFDDVKSEKLTALSQNKVISFEQKAAAIDKALKKFKENKYHIIGHSTGCGLGTFLAKKNKVCKSLILINPWNKEDEEFKTLQKSRVKNARIMDMASFLDSEYSLLYSETYIKNFKDNFNNITLKQKNKKIDYSFIERRLQSILKCNIGNELRKLVLPKLFINSVDDKLMKPYHAKELHKLCFNSKLITLDGGGHMLTETRAQDLIGHINSFVKVLGK
jgi:pimeloyl-ACP methyl ester carboxylesterase